MGTPKKNITVKYLKSWKIHEDGVKTGVYAYKRVTNSSYRRYYNTLCLLAGIGKSARDVLDYQCERMDNNNIVHSNASFRTQFISDVKEWTNGEIVYTDATVKKAIHTLVSKGLVLKTGTRGVLKVNPEYFFKGEESQRAREIRMTLEFKNSN